LCKVEKNFNPIAHPFSLGYALMGIESNHRQSMNTATASPEWNEMLNAAREGNPSALECVLKQSRQDLRRFAEYHCEINDMEDAVQDSLFTISRKIGDLRSLEAFTSWLFRIIKRECNRYKRLKRGLMQVPITEEIEGPHYPEQKALLRDLSMAMESLPAHYREIILLRDLQGLSIEELSTQLNLTTQAAKARLHRARSLAREYLMS
jgi:RNA polymerase sigma factor (sigma-70 family)